MHYYDTEFRRQRHRERVVEMREEYRRAQPRPRKESKRYDRFDASAMGWVRRQMRRRAARRAPAY